MIIQVYSIVDGPFGAAPPLRFTRARQRSLACSLSRARGRGACGGGSVGGGGGGVGGGGGGGAAATDGAQ